MLTPELSLVDARECPLISASNAWVKAWGRSKYGYTNLSPSDGGDGEGRGAAARCDGGRWRWPLPLGQPCRGCELDLSLSVRRRRAVHGSGPAAPCLPQRSTPARRRGATVASGRH